MLGAAFTSIGAENITSLEIKEIINSKINSQEKGVILFEVANPISLCSLCYRAQSIRRAVLLIGRFNSGQDYESICLSLASSMQEFDFKEWLHKKSFTVECEREGKHGYNSVGIEKAAAQSIIRICRENYSFTPKIDYDGPDVKFYICILDEKGYIGVDFSGTDLSKRQYKIFNHPESLKGITGYVLVRESGYSSGRTLLDPFMGSGVIVIEAALFASMLPVQYYNKEKMFFIKYPFFRGYGKDRFFRQEDSKAIEAKNIYGYDYQMRYLKAAQKNAKIAGVEKFMSLSRCDIDWLDTKFEKGSVDFIVTDPPRPSKRKEDSKLRKTYSEFFYQSDYILAKGGSITVLAKNSTLLEEAGLKHKFKIIKKHALFQGKEEFSILVFRREKDGMRNVREGN